MIHSYIVKFTAFLLACMACFALHNIFAVPIVLAAAGVGLLGTFIPFNKRFENHPQMAIYAGSFAGMCSEAVVSSFAELAFISLIGASFIVASKNLFVGFGGRLGGVAFASVAIVVLAKQLFLA